jgi:hypothetical protein
MEYVYLLTNPHVPKLVKFGFSRRSPALRAAELSAPTGVPGKWTVHHFWEVENGRDIEEAVFILLAKKRLGRKEFFEMDPAAAVAEISAFIGEVGKDQLPIARDDPKQIALEENERKRHLDSIRKKLYEINSEVSRAVEPLKAQFDDKSEKAHVLTSVIAFSLGCALFRNAGLGPAIFAGFILVGLGWILQIIPNGTEFWLLRQAKKQLEDARDTARIQVLQMHGLSLAEYNNLLRTTRGLTPDQISDYLRYLHDPLDFEMDAETEAAESVCLSRRR